MRNTELLIPASSLEVLKTAVLYGADAVYIGGRNGTVFVQKPVTSQEKIWKQV